MPARNFRRFDVQNKTIDGILDNTVSGAIVTLVSTVVMVLLFLSELMSYIKVDTSSHMAIANFHEHESVNVRLHVTFPYINCEDLEIIADHARGGLSGSDVSSVKKRTPSRSEMGTFKAAKEGGKVGCTLAGTIEVARAGGSIHLHVMHHDPATLVMMGSFISSTPGEKRSGRDALAGPNMTHVIHDFGFRSFDDQWGGSTKNPLSKTNFVSQEGSGQVRYNLQVVPMSHTRVSGREAKSFTYSSNMGFRDESSVMRQAQSRRWLGVELAYDFTPVMVRYTDSRKSFFEFVTSVCAIVGGVYTVSGLLVQGWQGVSRMKID